MAEKGPDDVSCYNNVFHCVVRDDSHSERTHTSMLTAVDVCVLAQKSAAHKKERERNKCFSFLTYNANDDTTFTSNFLLTYE